LAIGLMALVQTPEQLLALRVAQGALTGIVSAANAHVAAQTPAARRGMALALLQLSGFIGTTSGPLLGGLMAAHFGYRSVFLITAILLFGSGLLVWLVVHEEKAVETAPDSSIVHYILSGLKTVLQTPVLNQLYSIRMLATIGIFIVSPFMPLVVQNMVGTNSDPVVVTGVIEGLTAAVGAVAAVVVSGWMVSRIGYRRMLVLTALLAAASYGLQGLAHTTGALLMFRLLGGAATGSLLVTATTLQAQLVPRNRYGAAYAVDSSLISGANALGPMLGAYCAVSFGLTTVFWASALVFVIATGLARYISAPARLASPPPLLENSVEGKDL
jgi:DHA1 family multidrug resistance protein-like MFS transporter